MFRQFIKLFRFQRRSDVCNGGSEEQRVAGSGSTSGGGSTSLQQKQTLQEIRKCVCFDFYALSRYIISQR